MPKRAPQHRPANWKPSPNKRPDVQDPYYGSREWKALREVVLKRDGFQCTEVRCTTPNRGRGGRLIAGHIKARRDGGEDHPSNIRTFCPACDNRWHGKK